MEIRWTDGFEIIVAVNNGEIVISANREGLLSLADILTDMAREEGRTHIHLDQYNSLEEQSLPLVIEKSE